MKKILVASVAIATIVVAGQAVSAFAKVRPSVADPSASPVASASALPWQTNGSKGGHGKHRGQLKAHNTADVRSGDVRTHDVRTREVRTKEVRTPLAFSLDFRSHDVRSGDVRSGDIRFKPVPGNGGHAGQTHRSGHGRP
jgi:hypothetical protein